MPSFSTIVVAVLSLTGANAFVAPPAAGSAVLGQRQSTAVAASKMSMKSSDMDWLPVGARRALLTAGTVGAVLAAVTVHPVSVQAFGNPTASVQEKAQKLEGEANREAERTFSSTQKKNQAKSEAQKVDKQAKQGAQGLDQKAKSGARGLDQKAKQGAQGLDQKAKQGAQGLDQKAKSGAQGLGVQVPDLGSKLPQVPDLGNTLEQGKQAAQGLDRQAKQAAGIN